MNHENTFYQLLSEIKDYGSIKSPDFIAFVLPLLRDVQLLHEQNLTGRITSLEQIDYTNVLNLRTEGAPIVFGTSKLFLKPNTLGAIEIDETITQVSDVTQSSRTYSHSAIHTADEPLDHPAYLLSYQTWDYFKGHYDPLTDILVLGQIMASLAFGLDFADKEDLELFVVNRKRLYFLNKRLHPTILNVIFEMTELYREDRTANLEEVITKLTNYREYNPENYVDLTQTDGFRNQDITERGNWILSKLKNRLFDISRRNKLLYFSEKANFLNLTINSVPILLDHNNIQEDSLIFWNKHIKKKFVKSKKLKLNAYFEFAQNRFLAPSINKIRLEARKSKNEYGFSQLRVVIAFLHWYNFKEDSERRITSPLLLIPAEIVKKKGIEDQYILQFSSTEAEINPILSHYLKDLYGIALPDYIDLETSSVDELVQSIEQQIALGGTGITVEWRKKPKIQLIHSIAQRNLSLKNRKLRNRTSKLNLRSFHYSYQQEDFQPLGLQIFDKKIRHRNNSLEYIINDDLSLSQQVVAEKSRTFYSTNNDGEVNPLIWEVDTCNMTLGNFNYRKMSLVRDYNEIINTNDHNPIFDQLFNEHPKKLNVDDNRNYDLQNNYPIISFDPTQTASIQFARTGESYIIQGPPGTGKSQTITNLIADYISRDKKILFVCEKRAALDVVFHRLKNRKLDDLCCLIHDSQTDKKAFIMDLKETYEDFLKNNFDQKAIEKHRDQIITSIDQEINKIAYFHKTMQEGEVSALQLFEVLHLTKENQTYPADVERVYFPTYAEWAKHRQWITDWMEQLKNNGFDSSISTYPFAQLSSEILTLSNPKATILEKISSSTNLLDEFLEFIDDIDGDDGLGFMEWQEQFDLAEKLKDILRKDQFSVLDSNSLSANNLDEFIKDVHRLESKKETLTQQNKHWRTKFNETDTNNALEQWQSLNGSVFKLLNPSFYKLKSQIIKAYDFNAHAIKPSIENILQQLKAEYTAKKILQNRIKNIYDDFGIQDLENDYAWIKNAQQHPNKILSEWKSADKKPYIQSLIGFDANFRQLLDNVQQLFGKSDKFTLQELDSQLALGQKSVHSLSVFMPFIEQTHKVSDELKFCLYKKEWVLKDFDFNIAYKAISDIYEKERPFSEIDEDSLKVSIKRINKLLSQYYDSNVESIKAEIRTAFLDKVRITESVAAQLTPDEKIAKKSYSSARRILENEFGKSMRYKSIRDLASSDANTIMTTIKPVWLMSPLSVSDTMPIDYSLFDVVIYDEASQITVEEGIPALFRTKQTIIVGDEMQMPPTNFFSTSVHQDEEEDEVESRIGISLDADSLLNQGARKLSSVMLGWHYRSRRESLISFSNAAFYKRSLLTIPDSQIHHKKIETLAPISSEDAPIDIYQILNRSISFHYLENAIYDNRKNTDEANYIARMVSELLKQKVGKSIGIVAFSMQQQSEIESALDRLAVHDTEFETLLEEEYQREEEDSFNGLFVKNLENVQGDERDIIIMSVCYGYNTKGKMLMNFGPINRRGGEKRLNVIFSRAKQHMVVVTSIQPNEIKNDYNVGANFFKRFLAYAKNISDGRLHDANLILDGLHRHEDDMAKTANPVVLQLQKALEKAGHQMDLSIGQSHFKCDLGILNEDNNQYALGILLDRASHYQNDNILEQYCQKPQILNAFGWKIVNVYTKDWFEKPERVLEKIELALKGIDQEDRDARMPEVPIENPLIQEEVTDVSYFAEAPPVEAIKAPTNSIQFDRYEFSQGTSHKFWEICVDGTDVIVQFGRIGNKPQIRTKPFATAEEAKKEKEKMVEKKLGKGYVSVDG